MFFVVETIISGDQSMAHNKLSYSIFSLLSFDTFGKQNFLLEFGLLYFPHLLHEILQF